MRGHIIRAPTRGTAIAHDGEECAAAAHAAPHLADPPTHGAQANPARTDADRAFHGADKSALALR